MSYKFDIRTSDFEETGRQGKKPILVQSNNLLANHFYINWIDFNNDEIKKDSFYDFTNYEIIEKLQILQQPVYVKEIDGKQQIICDSSKMEFDKIYDVIWNNEKYGVRKTSKGIELLEFEPDIHDE